MTSISPLFPGTKLVAKQLNLIQIFSVVTTLEQRGFDVVREGELSETLVHNNSGSVFESEFPKKSVEFLEMMNNKEFRVSLKKIIYNKAPLQSDFDRIRPFSFSASLQNEQKYTKTMELLIAFLSIKNLSALSASFGVLIDGAPEGGDYDCIVNFQNSLFYFEIKSGDAINISTEELQNFLFRHDFLCPEASVLFLDSKKVGENVFKQFHGLKTSIQGQIGIDRIMKVTENGNRAYFVCPNVIAVDIANNNATLKNLKFALRALQRYKSWNNSALWNLVEPKYLGFEGEILISQKMA